MAKIPFLKQKETPAPSEKIEIEKHTAVGEVGMEVKEAEETGETQEIKKVEEAGKPAKIQEPVMTPSVNVAAPARPEDPLAQRIETILAEDLTDMYLKMPAKDQELFKQKGEETVSKVRELMTKTKVNAKKIFELIREWLKLIPGVNRFFLEQEAKIKTDKILFTKERE